MKTSTNQRMTVAALLTALGIIIPLLSPIKIILGPASYTLASHVPIFIAMFISPVTAIVVTIGTTIGFFFGGFPIVIVFRAASHIIFVTLGAFYLQKNKEISMSGKKLRIYSFIIGIIHSLAEVVVVSLFYFGGSMTEGYYKNGYVFTVLVLVGIGGLIHSMLDFEIAWLLTKSVIRHPDIGKIFSNIAIPVRKKVDSLKQV